MYVFSSYRRKWLFSLRLTKLCTRRRRQCLDSFASPFKKFNVLDRVARRYIDIFTEEIEVGKITQCENCGNLLSHFFDKNFVKVTFLPKKIPKSWFDEIFHGWQQIFHFSTLCCGNCRISLLSLSFTTFSQKFREINFFTDVNWFHEIFWCE